MVLAIFMLVAFSAVHVWVRPWSMQDALDDAGWLAARRLEMLAWPPRSRYPVSVGALARAAEEGARELRLNPWTWRLAGDVSLSCRAQGGVVAVCWQPARPSCAVDDGEFTVAYLLPYDFTPALPGAESRPGAVAGAHAGRLTCP